MYADDVMGLLILVAIFFFYVAVMKVCYWTCYSERWARRFINFFTYGLNVIFILFILLHNPFSSFNSFFGFIGSVIVITFITFMFNNVCCDVVIKDIKVRNERKARQKN